MPAYVEKEDFDMNKRKQIERSLREHNKWNNTIKYKAGGIL